MGNQNVEDSRFNSDTPIERPEDDLFGYDTFAASLAQCIRRMSAPEGAVLGINGPWGSGKSSAINLIKDHLKEAVEANEIGIITFNPWWITGQEALLRGFFSELRSTLGKTLGEKFQDLLDSTSDRLSGAAPVVGALAGLSSIPGIGPIAKTLAELAAKEMKSKEKSLDQINIEMKDVLRNHNTRFLVIIDDIDRLSPDDALLVFRLVKSVGRLPNIIYLLAFDRPVTEEGINQKFPSEGPQYIEKIFQATFDLPYPPRQSLMRTLEVAFREIAGPEGTASVDRIHWGNTFSDIIEPLVTSPRDVARLANTLSVSWGAVSGEVDLTNFFALEAIRLFRPELYRKIRDSKKLLCGTYHRMPQEYRPSVADYDRAFLDGFTDEEKAYAKSALTRLFPKASEVWDRRTVVGAELRYEAQRLICSETHFDTYFRFSVDDRALPIREVRELIEKIADGDFIASKLREYASIMRQGGGTRLPLALGSLTTHAEEIPLDKVVPFLATLFRLADELDVPQDENDFGGSRIRIHWLLNRLVLDRFDLEGRSRIFAATLREASLNWTVDLTQRFIHWKEESEGRLVTVEVEEELKALVIEKIRRTSETTEFLHNRDLPWLLFRWRDFEGDDRPVREWTDRHLANQAFLLSFAKNSPSKVTSGGLGDRVSRISYRVDLAAYEPMIDTERLMAEINRLTEDGSLNEEETQILHRFLAAEEVGRKRD